MPMPPNINPYDPRKKTISGAPTQSQQGSISTHDKKPEPQQQAPVAQSNLPPIQQQGQQQAPPAGQPQMQQPAAVAGQTPTQAAPPATQQKRKDLPVTYQQQAGAVVDPRFSQALTQKYTQELQQKQQAFEQQQAEYQKQLQQAQSGIGATADVQTQLSIINNPASTPEQIAAATAQYEKLMGAQAQQVEQSEAYKKAQAELSALTQLSGQEIAQKYGVGGGALRPDLGMALVGDSNLQQGLSLAQKYAQQAGEQQKAAQQQELLGQAKAEELKGLAKTGSLAAQSEFMQQLQQKEKVESAEKDTALSDLKNAIYLGSTLSDKQIENIKSNLGITDRQLAGMGKINLKRIEGFEDVKSAKDLKKKIKDLESSTKKITPEQQNLINFYKEMEGTLKRGEDVKGGYSAASKEELAKINALRKLTGETELTPEQQKEIGKTFGATKIASLGSALETMGLGTAKTTETKAAEQRIGELDTYSKTLSNALSGGQSTLGIGGSTIFDKYDPTNPEHIRKKQQNERQAFNTAINELNKMGPAGIALANMVHGIFNEQGKKDPLGALKKAMEQVAKQKEEQQKIMKSSDTLITKGLTRPRG